VEKAQFVTMTVDMCHVNRLSVTENHKQQ